MPDHAKIVLNRASIVLVGAFNTTIFQPAWFARQKLLRDAEVDAAEVTLVHPQLTQFRTDWVEVMITADRFAVTSRNGGYEGPLFDLVMGTFSILSHTPLTALGMNREVKVEFDTVERWHKFGDTLVPKDIWKPVLDAPGLLNLQMRSHAEANAPNMNVLVSSAGEKAVVITTNDHRPVPGSESAAPAIEILKASWESALARSDKVVEHLTKIVG